MESKRGIIIIGNPRSGKIAAIEALQEALKNRGKIMCFGIGSGDIASSVTALSMASSDAIIAAKSLNDSLTKLKERTPLKIASREDIFIDEALKLRSFQEDLKTIVYEKIENKFISKPRNNFRRR